MSNAIETVDFKNMPIGKLREYAKHIRVAVGKDAGKEEILELINRKLAGRTVPELADTSTIVKPGYAKIRVLEDASLDSKNYPVYVNINGYVATLPRGKDIVVPLRVVRGLNDAVAKRKRQVESDGFGPPKTTEINVNSFPFQVIEMNPGPDPLTKRELAAKQIMGPKRRYRAMFGRWPSPRELTRAIEQGFIKLDDSDKLGVAEESIMGLPPQTEQD